MFPSFAVTRQLNSKGRPRDAALAICTAFFVIMLFALGGQTILDYLHVSVPALQGAGGLFLLLLARVAGVILAVQLIADSVTAFVRNAKIILQG